ncbi:MAG: hypothetical protein M3Q03_03970, partial [Chloroflexota bacterium]|nr:hypothetical protein [Chloroflexota bacterium]
VFVFLPRRESEAIKAAIARAAAAEETLNLKGIPTSDEGRQARAAMLSRRDTEQARLNALIGNVVHAAKVYQGGGSEVAEGSLRASVVTAIDASLARLFPKFAPGDHPNWGRVWSRALDGAGDALTAIGYQGEAGDEPACREVRRFVGGTTKRGSEVLDAFKSPPYGWPADAVNGALLALVSAGQVRATKNGLPQPIKALNKQQIPSAEFTGEDLPITKAQMIALRGLLGDLGTPVKTDDEARAAVPITLKTLVVKASEAGGDAPAPSAPSTTYLEDLQALSGNAQLLAVYEARDRLRQDAQAWTAAKAKIATRRPRWETLQRLKRHGQGRSGIEALRPQIEAIRENRALLEEPDPITPLFNAVATELRAALREARDRTGDARNREIDHLHKTPEWKRLGDAEWQQILASNGLRIVPDIEIGTDEALLRTLDATPLADWEEKLIALPRRIAMARQEAARRLEPKIVEVRPKAATLKSADEVDAYLAEFRSDIMRYVDAGNPVMV